MTGNEPIGSLINDTGLSALILSPNQLLFFGETLMPPDCYHKFVSLLSKLDSKRLSDE